MKNFLLFSRWLASFWPFFSFLRRTLYSTWKSHYRQFQVLIMIFNRKAFLNISSITNSKNPPWNRLSFASRMVVNECLKNSVQNCFNCLLWIRIIGKTIKTFGFCNNTHLLDLSSHHVSSRDVFRSLSTIQDGALCENSQQILVVNYFHKTLYSWHLRWLWILLCHLWHTFGISMLNQVKREHISINL